MKLQKIRSLLIALGFLWIFFSTVLGGLIGARINASILQSTPIWILSIEKTLLISAHSHLNLMAIVTILIGLSLKYVWNTAYFKVLKIMLWLNVTSIPIFVLGLLIKSWLTYSVLVTGIITLGAILYIVSIGLYAALFAHNYIKQDL